MVIDVETVTNHVCHARNTMTGTGWGSFYAAKAKPGSKSVYHYLYIHHRTFTRPRFMFKSTLPDSGLTIGLTFVLYFDILGLACCSLVIDCA